jgi:hypothetical protein
VRRKAMTHDTPGLRAPASETIIRTQDEGWAATLSGERADDKDDPCDEFIEYWRPNWESKCSSSEGV